MSTQLEDASPTLTLSSKSWIAIVSVFQITALSVTIFRVYHRFKTSRMWWDDYVVVLVFMLDTLGFVNVWYGYSHHFDTFYLDGRLLFNFFLTYVFQFSTVWLTRVSLALSIARIFPKGHRARRISAALAIIFILNLIITVTVLNMTCQGGGVSWWKVTGKYCGKGPKRVFVGGVVSIILEILSDVVLTATPLAILWRVNLPLRSKRVIRVAFSGSVLMLVLFTACCIVWFDPGLNPKPGTALITTMTLSQIEMAVSLIVCNFLVTTTLLYKAWRKRFGRRRLEGQSTEAEDSSESDVDESSSRPDDTEHSTPSATEPESTQPRTIITFTDVMTDSELYQEMPTSTKPQSGGSKSG
ncbi:hypothetical protein K443DRAFT_14202 [Laccaria amethystina LaAM-08-1]|uniref:Rhodopsin domain-containing protein n=1 Tax=Laccaria amethystina LaAM-08-1 TaxID=1095629 RepID=A0A0C9WHS0_9AGAR|nr:hypothetical protein K443DRAFT_14202 [Laccaria amethystina LaAM-08-1]